MSKVCTICKKKPGYGNKVSHANNRTRRRWMPNLQSVRANMGGTVKRVVICTRCLRSNKIMKAA